MSSGSMELPIGQVESGTRLGEALRDAHGAVLLPEGTVLGEAHVASLRIRGVGSVPVAPPEDTKEPGLAARREAVVARLARLFRHGGDGEANQALYRVALEYHLGRMR